MLNEIIKKRVLILDGAMGTMIHKNNLTAADYGGKEYEGCPEILNVTRPDVIREIHEAYLEAGADIIETNTFGGTRIVLSDYALESRMDEFNRAGVKNAKEAANKFSTPEKPRFVAGSMGPTTKAFSVTGGITFDNLTKNFYEQSYSLLDAGADLILIETCQDTVNIKAAVLGVKQALKELSLDKPIMISVTIEPNGRMLAGQTIEAMYNSISHAGIFSIGLNCATGPDQMADHVRTISEISKTYINVCPNAGMPDETGHYKLDPTAFSNSVLRYIEHGWVNIVGGCCGTSPDHIRKLAEVTARKKGRIPSQPTGLTLSGIDSLEITDDNKPVIVGERTNVIGSRKFKKLITEEKFSEAAEVGIAQIKGGAQIVDVCLGNPDRDELADMISFMGFAANKIKAPFMIDSTNAQVIEEALKRVQGKCVINSINLENGEERFQEVVPLVLKYGAAIVVGTIDEDPEHGMAITRKRKLEIAKRSYDLLVNKFKVSPENIIFDPLVFPVGTGDKAYVGAAEETIEGLRLIKKEIPQVSTILGVSNISFGLPPSGREVLNAVFLYHTTKAGLDFAIVNSETLRRFASIPENERLLAENLLFFRGSDPLNAFINFYKDNTATARPASSSLSLEDRLSNYIVEGTVNGLTDDLDLALKEMKPLDIVNGPLMKGMAEVGVLFNENKLIVAEVLQSAESMKRAVNHLKPFMEKGASESKGKIILATVKGDVHDIGKNLVEIILSNNGFQVIDLGIKVLPEEIIAAQKKENADMIGLSGLLVKSAQQMIPTAEDIKSAGIDIPILVGGAALSNKFVIEKIQPAYDGPVLYARDAMDGLTIANNLSSDAKDSFLKSRSHTKPSDSAKEKLSEEDKRVTLPVPEKLKSVPKIPFYDLTIRADYDLEEIFSYINPIMLFGKHLGLRGSIEKKLIQKDAKAIELKSFVEEFQKEIIQKSLINPKSIMRFFPACSENDSIIIFDPENSEQEVERFSFPRQKGGICLSDYLLPKTDSKKDSLVMFLTTAGEGVTKLTAEYRESGEYLKSHTLAAIALETAEALAEYAHKEIRANWGFPDPADFTRDDLFKMKYRGCRYSFGYPACPDITLQSKLFNLLQPEKIGVTLTEGSMMDPEASVSAVVFHHPEARYFSVK